MTLLLGAAASTRAGVQQRTAVVPYGCPPPRSLLPCASAADTGTSCTAVAFDATGNDLSASLAVTDASNCSSTPSSAAGQSPCAWPCDLSTAGQGACLPGQYRFNYSVTDANGRSATAQLQLQLVQRFQLGGALTLEAPVASAATAAMTMAATVQANSSLAAMLSSAVAAVLSSPLQQAASIEVDGASTAASASSAPLPGARRLAQVGAPPPSPWNVSTLQLAFTLNVSSTNASLYTGVAPQLPPAIAAVLALTPVQGVFGALLQQQAAAACSAALGVLAASPDTAALVASGGWSCAFPAPAQALITAISLTPSVNYTEASWLPVLAQLAALQANLQALQATLAATDAGASALDPAQQLAAVSVAWDRFASAYMAGDVTQAQLKALASALGSQQLMLALPLLPSAALAATAAGAVQQQYTTLANLSTINLFESGLLSNYANQSAYCQQQVCGDGLETCWQQPCRPVATVLHCTWGRPSTHACLPLPCFTSGRARPATRA